MTNDYIGVNIKNETVRGYKKFHEETACVISHKYDINSSTYYPSYYTSKHSVKNFSEFLSNKYSLVPPITNNIIVFTKIVPLSHHLHKV